MTRWDSQKAWLRARSDNKEQFSCPHLLQKSLHSALHTASACATGLPSYSSALCCSSLPLFQCCDDARYSEVSLAIHGWESPPHIASQLGRPWKRQGDQQRLWSLFLEHTSTFNFLQHLLSSSNFPVPSSCRTVFLSHCYFMTRDVRAVSQPFLIRNLSGLELLLFHSLHLAARGLFGGIVSLQTPAKGRRLGDQLEEIQPHTVLALHSKWQGWVNSDRSQTAAFLEAVKCVCFID